MKVEEIPCWEAFVAVAKQGNFSKAARLLQTPIPQVSKRITKLESQLGVRLFQRTTRNVSLTDEGRVLLPKIDSIISDLQAAENIFESNQRIAGSIKITCVPFIAHRLLIPVMKKFRMQYPDIQLDLQLAESFTNIVESGLDMAIRIETPKDSDLVYRKLVPNDLVFCASPDYLKMNKHKLKTPMDLKQHEVLALSIHRRCKFIDSDLKIADVIPSQKLNCDNGAFLTDLALNDFGVLLRSIWDVQEYLRQKKLVQVLKQHPLETFGHVYAVVPSKRYLAPRVRVFLDFLIDQSKLWKL